MVCAETIAVFALSGFKRACQCLPRPVAFALSIPGHDRASLVLRWGLRPGFSGPPNSLGQSGLLGARGVIKVKGGVYLSLWQDAHPSVCRFKTLKIIGITGNLLFNGRCLLCLYFGLKKIYAYVKNKRRVTTPNSPC